MAVKHLGQMFANSPEQSRLLIQSRFYRIGFFRKIYGGYYSLLNTRTNSFEGNVEETNAKLKLQKPIEAVTECGYFRCDY